MELLVILLGEFLFFPFVIALAGLCNLVVTAAGLVFEVLILFLPQRAGPAPSENEKTQEPKQSFRLLHPLIKVLAGLCALIVLMAVLINAFYFESALKLMAADMARKKGMEISFFSAQGNFFTGFFELRDLKVKTLNSKKTDFDLSARHVVLDIDMFSIASSPIKIETLHVEGIEGDVRSKDAPPAKAPAPPPSQGPSPTSPAPEKLKAKKPFVIQDLALKDIKLRLHKGTHEPLLLSLSSMDSKPLRSQYAIFDTFFRSNISGDLDGHEIMIRSREAGQGRETHWRLDDFPVKVIGQFIDKAPLNWFKDGTLDVTVEDQWAYGDQAEIAMDWSLIFNAVKLEAPENTSLTQRALAAPFVHYINGKDGPVDLSFTLVMNEDQFDGSASLDAAGLWDILVDTMSKKLAQMSGQKKDAIKEGVKDTVDSFKSFLNKKRTGQSEVDEIKAPE
ncbi:MAG: hypothetical protein KDI90_05365 [Alphaproteobacteria bacterium]|nr:hypothetical protein [Alphaproteobacteria bacterium]MCB9974242.1 hypothetical protein [Rhodospirillales bacterium]